MLKSHNWTLSAAPILSNFGRNHSSHFWQIILLPILATCYCQLCKVIIANFGNIKITKLSLFITAYIMYLKAFTCGNEYLMKAKTAIIGHIQ